MPGIESRFRSRKALVDAAFVSFVCAIIVATRGRFRPLVLFFFISIGLIWLMGCKFGRSLGNTLGQDVEGEPRWNTKFTRRLVRADVSFLGPLIGRLGALWITVHFLGEQLILMGRVGASNWQGFLMIGSAVSGIAIAEKIHRETIGFKFGPGMLGTGGGFLGMTVMEELLWKRRGLTGWAIGGGTVAFFIAISVLLNERRTALDSFRTVSRTTLGGVIGGIAGAATSQVVARALREGLYTVMPRLHWMAEEMSVVDAVSRAAVYGAVMGALIGIAAARGPRLGRAARRSALYGGAAGAVGFIIGSLATGQVVSRGENFVLFGAVTFLVDWRIAGLIGGYSINAAILSAQCSGNGRNLDGRAPRCSEARHEGDRCVGQGIRLLVRRGRREDSAGGGPAADLA